MVEDVSAAVGMSLWTKKCAVAHMIAGKVVEAGDIPLKTGGTVLEVKYGKTYRYLGVPQLLGADLKDQANDHQGIPHTPPQDLGF